MPCMRGKADEAYSTWTIHSSVTYGLLGLLIEPNHPTISWACELGAMRLSIKLYTTSVDFGSEYKNKDHKAA